MSKYLSLLFSILTLFFSISVYAQNDSGLFNIDVEGQALVRQNDIARARQESINDALKNAVLAAASKLLSIPVKDEKFQPVKSFLTDEPDKYINAYKISAERKDAQTYIVSINASVVLTNLNNNLNQKGFFQSAPAEEKQYLTIFLNVQGLKKYADYSQLKEFLQSRTKTVKSIYPCRFAWQQAHFEIKIYESAQSLANEMAKISEFKLLDIKQTDKNHTEINFMHQEEKS